MAGMNILPRNRRVTPVDCIGPSAWTAFPVQWGGISCIKVGGADPGWQCSQRQPPGVIPYCRRKARSNVRRLTNPTAAAMSDIPSRAYLGSDNIICAASSRCPRRYAPGVVPVRANRLWAWRTDTWRRRASSPQVRVGQVFAGVYPHHVEQHVPGTVPARYRGPDVTQHHCEQVDRGPPGVQPLPGGEVVGHLEQPTEVADEQLHGRGERRRATA
jgi:hypothetical protein